MNSELLAALSLQSHAAEVPMCAIAPITVQAPVSRSALYAGLNGVFSVYKPRGVTTRDLVNIATEILSTPGQQVNGVFVRFPTQKQRVKMGHGGTLDKQAEGVVILATEGGTKQLAACLAGEKEYLTTGLLGVNTDTHDLDADTQVQGEAQSYGEEETAGTERRHARAYTRC